MGPYQRRFEQEKLYGTVHYADFMNSIRPQIEKTGKQYMKARTKDDDADALEHLSSIFEEGVNEQNIQQLNTVLGVLWVDFMSLTVTAKQSTANVLIDPKPLNAYNEMIDNLLEHACKLVTLLEFVKSAVKGDELRKLKTEFDELNESHCDQYDRPSYEERTTDQTKERLKESILNFSISKKIASHMETTLAVVKKYPAIKTDIFEDHWNDVIKILKGEGESNSITNNELNTKMGIFLKQAALIRRFSPPPDEYATLEFQILRVAQLLFQSMDYAYMQKTNGELEILKDALMEATGQQKDDERVSAEVVAEAFLIKWKYYEGANKGEKKESPSKEKEDTMRKTLKWSTISTVMEILHERSFKTSIKLVKKSVDQSLSDIAQFENFEDKDMATNEKTEIWKLIKAMQLMVTAVNDFLENCFFVIKRSDLE
eukprot:GHVL01022140.1.p1 GENE.GHVL01022140.1~~GHVL01022140.1.p1  ORF type:complete len:429 (-),score=75.32 GHVL01022140.1:32-1318(-)